MNIRFVCSLLGTEVSYGVHWQLLFFSKISCKNDLFQHTATTKTMFFFCSNGGRLVFVEMFTKSRKRRKVGNACSVVIKLLILSRFFNQQKHSHPKKHKILPQFIQKFMFFSCILKSCFFLGKNQFLTFFEKKYGFKTRNLRIKL